MIIVNENTAGIDNLASPLDIFSSKEPYSGTERRISCFFDYDCKKCGRRKKFIFLSAAFRCGEKYVS